MLPGANCREGCGGMVEVITCSPYETKELGRKFGKLLVEGDRLFLEGDLGAGKTVFVQGVAEGLGVKKRVISPTFVILRVYEGRLTLYHLDLYRLLGVEEMGELEWEDLIFGDEGVVVVEWASRLGAQLPKERLELHFEVLSKNKRKIGWIPWGEKYVHRFSQWEEVR